MNMKQFCSLKRTEMVNIDILYVLAIEYNHDIIYLFNDLYFTFTCSVPKIFLVIKLEQKVAVQRKVKDLERKNIGELGKCVLYNCAGPLDIHLFERPCSELSSLGFLRRLLSDKPHQLP